MAHKKKGAFNAVYNEAGFSHFCFMRKEIGPEIKTQLREVGTRLRAIRKARGYSNYDRFAYENDISRSQYGRYENGSDMHLSTLLKLLEAHGVTVQDFFSDDWQEKLDQLK